VFLPGGCYTGCAWTDVSSCPSCFADKDISSVDAIENHYNKRRTSQQKWIKELQGACDDVSASGEFKANGSSDAIAVTQVPFFDVELVGAPALSYVGGEIYKDAPSFAQLLGDDDIQDGPPKFVICGGKGGVGKTTTSSSLAVTMANAGHKVAVVSTDPAHSLGDALQMDLKGGKLIDVPLYSSADGGSLSAMEVDPSEALKEFKGIVDSLISTSGAEGDAESMGGTLKDLGEVFDTLPAGTDEVVALAKVINLVKKGGFDRIVLDTAPTGHTLRMLSTPSFIAELIDRVLIISEKINSNPTVKMLLAGAAKGRDLDSMQESARATLLDFQFQMYDLEDLFSNAEQTEFLIVTIPTALATRESIRLLNDLTFDAPDMPIKVRNVVMNQVISDDGSDAETFVQRVSDSQAGAVTKLLRFTDTLPSPPTITQIGYLDTEPRGVFGLKALALEMMKEALEPAPLT
jgi:arsenite-transporting ATPase